MLVITWQCDSKRSHYVWRLAIYLPGQYQFSNIDLAQEDLADSDQKGLTLETYFWPNRNLKQTEEKIFSTEIFKKWFITIIEKILNNKDGFENPDLWIPRSSRMRVIG